MRCCSFFFFLLFFSSTRFIFRRSIDRSVVFVPSTRFGQGRKRCNVYRDNIVMQSNRDYFSFGGQTLSTSSAFNFCVWGYLLCTSCKRREVFLLRRFADPRRDRRLKTGEREREGERQREREKRRGSRLKTNTLLRERGRAGGESPAVRFLRVTSRSRLNNTR